MPRIFFNALGVAMLVLGILTHHPYIIFVGIVGLLIKEGI